MGEMAQAAPGVAERRSPSESLLALIPRFISLDPATVAPADRCTFGNAPAMLRRLAGKLASNDPATVALGVAQIRSVGAAWVDPRSPAAQLWGEAVAAVADLAPGVAAAASPAAAFQGMIEQAYQRGRADERAQTVKAIRSWVANGHPRESEIDGSSLADWIATEIEEGGCEPDPEWVKS